MSTYKTWVKGAHLLIDGGRTRRYTGLIPKISPLAIVTIALAQAKIDRMAKHVPLDAPWTAKRAAEWDSRSVAWWLERSGIRTAIARDLFEMAVRGLFTGDLNEVSLLHLLFLARAHGSINTLFSIEGGAQENMVEGGAGSIAQRVADELGRCRAPERTGPVDHPTRRPRASSTRAIVTVSARHAVVVGAARARPRDRVRSRRSPTTASRCTATRSPARSRRRSSSTTSRSGAPTGSAARPPSPTRPPRSRSTRPRRPGAPASSRRSRSDRSPTRVDALDAAERRRRRARRAHGQVRPARRVTVASSSRRRGGRRNGRAAARWRTSPRASSPATGRCSASRSDGCTGREPRPSTTSHGAIDGAVRSGERAAAEILDRA